MKINFNGIISDVKKVMQMSDVAHDFFHIERVMEIACFLSHGLNVNLDIVKLIALLHDVDDYKINDTHELRAKKILDNYCVPKSFAEFVLDAIDNISFSKGKIPSSLEGKIVQDADRIDAIGAVGIARVFSYGGSKDIPIYDPSGYCSIQHFYDKLLQLPNTLNLEKAKKLASNRATFMKKYLDEFFEEISLRC